MPVRLNSLPLQLFILVLFTVTSLSLFAADIPVKLRLQWKHQFEFAGFYAAKEQGYYADLGLDVELLEYENGLRIVDEVSAGGVEFGIWGSGLIERAMLGDDIVLLANYFKRSPLALAVSPEISFPSELEGKTLMVSESDIASANYLQMFETFNVDISKINFVEPSFTIDEFTAGEVDGVSIFLTNEPYLLKRAGVPYNVIDPSNYGVDLYDVNLFTSKDYAEEHPKEVEAFIEASNRGWQYALDNPEELVDIILAKYNTQNKSREHLIYEAQQTVRMMQAKSYPIGSIDEEQVNRIGNLFTEVGLVDRRLAESFIFRVVEPEIALTPSEQAFLDTKPVVTVAMMPDFTPFSYISQGEAKGFEHDLLALLSKKTGIIFKPLYGIWNEGLSAFKAREADMIASISYREERTAFTRFTDPYYEIPIMIYVREDFGSYQGLNSLTGKRVGILKDVFYAQELEKIGDMELVIYETYDQLTKALVYGRIDALMQNQTNIDALIRDNAYTNLRLAGELQLPNIQREDLRFGVRSDWPELHAMVQKGLQLMTEEERLTLSDRWLGIKAKDDSVKVSFTSTERDYLAQKGAFNLCVDPAWLPLEGIDETGQHVGISADILQELSRNTGIALNLVQTNSWQQTLDFAKTRRCDLISLAMRTPSRETYLDFTLPYVSYPFVIATRDQNQFIDDLSIVNGKKLAMLRGYSSIELIAANYPEIEIIEVDSLAEGVAKVRQEEVYGYVDALPPLASAIQKEGMTDMYIAGKLDEEFALSIAVRNDEPLILSIMQKALATVSAESIQRINNRWLAVRFESRIDYTLLYQVIAGFMVIGLLVLWRQREIQRTKKIIEEKNLLLEELAMTDMLTGLYNRHKMDQALTQQKAVANRYNTNFAVMILDIDHFKRINDTYGHNVGDTSLKAFAQILREQTRESDLVGRWGGEEFLILIPEADKVSLEQMAENLRANVERYPFDVVGQLTTSVGVAVYHPGESIRELVSRADNALYRAKNSDRNCVVFDTLSAVE